jgi:hypothetical protein
MAPMPPISILAEASVCVVASREKLAAANADLGQQGLELEEVFG